MAKADGVFPLYGMHKIEAVALVFPSVLRSEVDDDTRAVEMVASEISDGLKLRTRDWLPNALETTRSAFITNDRVFISHLPLS